MRGEQLEEAFEFDSVFSVWTSYLTASNAARSGKASIYSFPELRNPWRCIDTFKGFSGFGLADMLPDKYGNSTHSITWADPNGRQSDSLNPVEQLCFIGKRGVGALEIRPSMRSEVAKASTLEIDSLVH